MWSEGIRIINSANRHAVAILPQSNLSAMKSTTVKNYSDIQINILNHRNHKRQQCVYPQETIALVALQSSLVNSIFFHSCERKWGKTVQTGPL